MASVATKAGISKQYSIREVKQILSDNGYIYKRRKGSHCIYSNGTKEIVLPVVSLNYKLGNRLVKEILG
ncbi:MAG: type II toxin-antitoxin system HicA family toxin [Oscillospiraceae bacterium]